MLMKTAGMDAHIGNGQWGDEANEAMRHDHERTTQARCSVTVFVCRLYMRFCVNSAEFKISNRCSIISSARIHTLSHTQAKADRPFA